MINSLKKLILPAIFVISFFVVEHVSAATICDTNLQYNGSYCSKPISCQTNIMYNGFYCNGLEGKSWNKGTATTAGCNVETDCPANPTNGTYNNNCTTNTCVLSCVNNYTACGGSCIATISAVSPCATYDTCNNRCGSCISTHSLCTDTYTCVLKKTCLPGQTFDACSNSCTGNASILKLGADSVSGTNIIQSASSAYSTLFISGLNQVGIGTSTPDQSSYLSITPGSGVGINLFGGIIRGLSDPVLNQDAATKAYVDSTIPNLVNPIIASSSIWQLLGNNTYYNNGNVGIGTNNPSHKLVVNAATSSVAAAYFQGGWSGVPVLQIDTSNGQSAPSISLLAGSAAYPNKIRSVSDFAIETNGANERFRITAAGYVGIGTSTPLSALHVQGGLTFPQSGGIYSYQMGQSTLRKIFGSDTSDGGSSSYFSFAQLPDFDGDDGFQIRPYNGNRTNALLTVLSGGNVGIGTTTPSSRLTFPLDTAKLIDLGGGRIGNVSDPATSTDAATKGYVDLWINNNSFWSKSGSNIYYNGGNVGIGTTSPIYGLDVQSTENLYTARFYNPTPTTGKTQVVIRAGAGNTGGGTYEKVLAVQNSSGSEVWGVRSDGMMFLDTFYTNDNRVSLFGGTSATSGLNLSSGLGIRWSSASGASWPIDSGITRISAGKLAVGNGVNNDFSGSLIAGSIGIGTSTPPLKLSVLSNVNYPDGLLVQNTNGGTEAYSLLKIVTDGGESHRSAVLKNSSTKNAYGGAHALSFYQFGADPISFVTNNATTPQMILSGSGNIGIGTTTPSVKLSFLSDTSKLADFGGGRIGNVSDPATSTDAATKGYVDSTVVSAVANGGSIGKFVGLTTNEYDGKNSAAGVGYVIANDLCANDFPGSHVCATYEMMNTIVSKQTNFLPVDSASWVFNGPPGYTWTANDCLGRNDNQGINYGTVWVIPPTGGKGYGSLDFCNSSRKLACCK